MTIETVTGSVSAKSGGMTITAFYRKSKDSDEIPLHLAEKDRTSGIVDLKTLDIIQSGSRKTSKVWSRKRHNFPDGSYLKIVMIRMKAGAAMGSGMHCLMLRPRQTAPLYRISVSLPTDEHSTQSVVHYEGRFDILSPKQVHDLGLHKNKMGANDLGLFDFEPFKEFLKVHKLEEGIVPMVQPKVVVRESSRGDGTKKLLKIHRRRNIRGQA